MCRGTRCKGVRLRSSLGGHEREMVARTWNRQTLTNICTEDTVHMLDELGVETGIDLAALCEVAKQFEDLLGHPLPGQVMHAGPRLRRYTADEALCAVGS